MPQIWPVIATRERPDWLRKQLDALIPQIEKTERIVVVFDGDIPGQIPAPAESVLRIALSERKGVYMARRTGNAHVPSDAVICEIDDHDIAEPELLAELRGAFADSRVMIAYCDVWHTDPEGKIRKLREKHDGSFAEHGQLGWGMKAYRKWAYDCVGGYPTEYKAAGDFALMCCLEDFCGGDGAVVHIRKPLVTVLQTRDSVSGHLGQEQQDAVSAISSEAFSGGWRHPFKLLPMSAEEAPNAQIVEPGIVPAPVAPSPVGAPVARRKPRLCLVTDYVGIGRGGGELSMMGLLRKCHAAGYEITALYVRDAGREPDLGDWIALHKCPEMISVRGRHGEASEAFRAALRKINPDLIVTEAGTAANIVDAARTLGYPTLTLIQFWRGMVHGAKAFDALNADGPYPGEIIDKLGCAQIARAAALIANSEFSADVTEKCTGRKPEAVVYPPVTSRQCVALDAPRVSERENIACLSVQSLKGIEIFIELARLNPHRKFIVVGGDYQVCKERHLVDEAENLSNITVLREWQDDMRPIYANMRLLFIGTQTCESFSRTAAEARTNGIPLLVSDAGNLVNMAAGGHGVVVPRKAPIGEWVAGLEAALTLTPEPDVAYCQDHSARFIESIRGARNLSEVVILTPGAIGIRQGVEQFRRVLGMRVADWHHNAQELADWPLVITPGCWNKDIASASNGKVAAWWCSHFAQMDTNRHEMANLLQAVAAVRENPRGYLLMTSKADAETWATVIGPRAKWLPNCMELPATPPQPEKLDGRHVFICGPYVERKNIYTSLAACVGLNAEAHVTQLADKAEALYDLAKALGMRVHVHECPDRRDVAAIASQCQAAIMVSSAETYCYAAAECLLAGTPVVAWEGLPAIGLKGARRTTDPTNVAQVRATLQTVFDKPQRVWVQQYAETCDRIRTMNRAARDTLLEVLDA